MYLVHTIMLVVVLAYMYPTLFDVKRHCVPHQKAIVHFSFLGARWYLTIRCHPIMLYPPSFLSLVRCAVH